ncbi:MAG: hypothetical protein RDV48_24280 [Candidatus Eremiobacteraeota bacterium]|nr:hypothetical protein [Candidatus Eremiobacteraeota bacterium]
MKGADHLGYRSMASFAVEHLSMSGRTASEVQELIRTGSWYAGPSLCSSWQISSGDEDLLAARDRCFEKPWNNFSDVDEMLACEAQMKVEKNSVLCASEKSAEKVRQICTMPQGASPEETFLVDILSVKDPSPAATGSMMIKFFLPAELYDLWNIAAMAFLHLTAQAEATQTDPTRHDLSQPFDAHVLPEERFLAALMTDYLTTEGTFHKAAHHHRILKRDRFRCQAADAGATSMSTISSGAPRATPMIPGTSSRSAMPAICTFSTAS